MTSKNVTQIESNIKPDEPVTANPLVTALVAILRDPTVGAALREIIAAPADEWLGKDEAERESGVKMATICGAARRGEIQIGYAGRSPRVRRSELERWIGTKKHPLAKARPEESTDLSSTPTADVYELAVRRARSGR